MTTHAASDFYRKWWCWTLKDYRTPPKVTKPCLCGARWKDRGCGWGQAPNERRLDLRSLYQARKHQRAARAQQDSLV